MFVLLQFEANCHLIGHSESVTAVDAVYIGDHTLIVSVSADSTLRVWTRTDHTSG